MSFAQALKKNSSGKYVLKDNTCNTHTNTIVNIRKQDIRVIQPFFLYLRKCFIVVRSTQYWGFPGGSDGKESACNAGDLGSIPGSGNIPWRRAWQPTPIFLSGEFHGQRRLVGYSPWGRKESDMTEYLTWTQYHTAHIYI